MPPSAMTITDLDEKYRPRTLADVIGQDDAVRTIRSWGKDVPRCVMFFGHTGAGKTTLAGAISSEVLGVEPSDGNMDYRFVNCGTLENPKDAIRSITETFSTMPMTGKRKVYVFDEIQEFIRSHGAQSAVLSPFEKAPPWVQIFLCTTDPKKLNKAVLGRCTQVEIKPLCETDIRKVVTRVASAEGVDVSAEVMARIVELSDGSARIAVKNLEKVARIPADKDRLSALGHGFGEEADSFGLVKVLLPWKGEPSWAAVAPVLLKLKEESQDAEGLRLMVINSARAMLLKGANPLAYKTIQCLREPYFNAPSAFALLVADCFKVCVGK